MWPNFDMQNRFLPGNNLPGFSVFCKMTTPTPYMVNLYLGFGRSQRLDLGLKRTAIIKFIYALNGTLSSRAFRFRVICEKLFLDWEKMINLKLKPPF